MTIAEFEQERASLLKQYEELKAKVNQVLGAMMWIDQTVEKLKNADARESADKPS